MKINQFALGNGSFSKTKILNAETKKQAGIIYFYCDEQGNINDIDNKLVADAYRQQKVHIVDNILRAQYLTGDNEAYRRSLAKYSLAASEVCFTPKAYLSAEENLLGLHFNTNKTQLIRLVDMGIKMTRAEATVFKASFADGSAEKFLFVFDDSLLQPKCLYWEPLPEPEDTALNTKLWWEAEKKYKNNPDKYAWRHRVL